MSGENAVQDVRGGGGSPGCTSPKDAEAGETPAERRQGILDGVGCKPLWSSRLSAWNREEGKGVGAWGRALGVLLDPPPKRSQVRRSRVLFFLR
jgi:hypothetical protein